MSAFKHVLDRYGLWDLARRTEPLDEFGPMINVGFMALSLRWGAPVEARQFVQRATRAELATFMCLMAAIGEDLVASGDWRELAMMTPQSDADPGDEPPPFPEQG